MTRGRRGRDALTDSQRRALGRPSKVQPVDKIPGLSVPTSLPEPPSIVASDAAALEEWNRVGRFLKFTRRVSELDMQSLAVYCLSWSMYGEAIRPLLIGRQRLWGMATGKPRPAKLEEVARRHAMIVIEQARRFGMTARTRHLDHADSGRPALPNELHELRGNPSKKMLVKASLAANSEWEPDDVREPYWFDRVASAQWHHLVETFTNLQLFTPLDYSVLAIGCGSWALYSKAASEIADTGLVGICEENGNAVEHPLSVIMRAQREVMKQVWIDYGMSPLDRRRFKHSIDSSSEKAKFSVYIGEG